MPDQIDGKPWQAYDTAAMVTICASSTSCPASSAFEGLPSRNLRRSYKLLLTTPGIDTATGSYSSSASRRPFWPTTCAKTDRAGKMRSQLILFLLTPAEDIAKMQHLVA